MTQKSQAAALADRLAREGVPFLTVRQQTDVATGAVSLAVVYPDGATAADRTQGDMIRDGFAPAAEGQRERGSVRAESQPALSPTAVGTGDRVRIVADAMRALTNDRLMFLFRKVAGLLGTTSAALEAEFGRPAQVSDEEVLAYVQQDPTLGDSASAG